MERLRFAPDMPSITTRRGVRARKVCGRIRRTTPKWTTSITSRELLVLTRMLLSAAPQNCGLQLSFLQPSLSARSCRAPNPDSFTGTIQTQPLNFKQGMVQQFNLNFEYQLPGEVVMTAGYAGARSTHILNDGLNQNIGSPTACAGGPNAQPGYTLGCGPGGTYFPAPYGEFTSIDNNSDNGRARYDSLQIKAEKNARHGLYALLSYTYSRAFDSGFPDGLGTLPGAMYWPLPGAQKLDWSLSQINLNNQFTASVLYDLPFGKGKKFGSGWNGVDQCSFRKLETECDRESDLRLSACSWLPATTATSAAPELTSPGTATA